MDSGSAAYKNADPLNNLIQKLTDSTSDMMAADAASGSPTGDDSTESTPIKSGFSGPSAMDMSDFLQKSQEGSKSPFKQNQSLRRTSLNATSPMPAEDLNPKRLGRPFSSDSVKTLQEMCNLRAVQPEFQFAEVASQKFQVKLRLGDVVLEDPGPFHSKKEAKAIIAQRGIEVASDIPVVGLFRDANEPFTNWIGMLLEHCQALRIPAPIYQEYRLGEKLFAADLRLASHPDRLFGDSKKPFRNKKDAKAAAAKEAVLWLQQKNRLPRAPNMPNQGKLAELSSSTSQVPEEPFSRDGELGSGLDGIAEAAEAAVEKTSYAQQVHDLATKHGLGSAMYSVSPTPGTSFYSGTVEFPQSHLIRGHVASVANMYGKKNAKEELAKKALIFVKDHVEKGSSK